MDKNTIYTVEGQLATLTLTAPTGELLRSQLPISVLPALNEMLKEANFPKFEDTTAEDFSWLYRAIFVAQTASIFADKATMKGKVQKSFLDWIQTISTEIFGKYISYSKWETFVDALIHANQEQGLNLFTPKEVVEEWDGFVNYLELSYTV